MGQRMMRLNHNGMAIPRIPALEEIKEQGDEQVAEAQQFFIDFMKKIVRLKGVRIDRGHFLRSELRKRGVSRHDADLAVKTSPVTAGIDRHLIDGITKDVIAFETRKSTALSFAAGLPGRTAMAGAIPADIAQYYVHAFRIMQKLAYLYGWQAFLDECDEVDDETLFEMATMLAVMMGVAGANAGLNVLAKNMQQVVGKRVANMALMKTTWYPLVKKLLNIMGVKITRQTVGNAAGKVVVGLGGVVSGGITFVGLTAGATRLSKQLRRLPQATEPMLVDGGRVSISGDGADWLETEGGE